MFSYTPEWYATESVPWLPAIKTAEDLLYHYTDPTILPFIANGVRWQSAFKDYPDLSGRCLELGFNSGLTVHRMAEKYPDLKVDGIDFNPAVERLIPFIKSFNSNVDDLWIGDTQDIDKPSSYYDYITSLDFFEHLPLRIYIDTLGECCALLKSGGKIWVYFGRPEAQEHINRRDNIAVVEDFKSYGVNLCDIKGEVLIFQKS